MQAFPGSAGSQLIRLFIIFYDRLILNGANKAKSKLMFKAVSIGAKQFWKLRPEKIKALELLYILIKKNDRFDEYCFPKEVLGVV